MAHHHLRPREMGMDFLSQLSLAENRDAENELSLRAMQRGGKRKISFYPGDVTSIEDCAANVDRQVIPCLAHGGVNYYSPEEERAATTKQVIKDHRTSIARGDPIARRQFNEAAAEEARLRAVHVREAIDRDKMQAGRESEATAAAEKQMIDRQYQELLALQQRANMQYQQQQQGQGQQRQMQVQHREHQQHQHQQFAKQRLYYQQQEQSKSSTRIVAPPGGRSSLVLG
uniref:Uncharacterized protein n=1 Tax=Haptolina brevifila TaxID=156173 RepID=A0A7S2E022_9EUKA|mmetsp:Transcript_46369/g.92583  ORF Transcript_46369/g.92583 Transcript_46369/m.92583 type:complete len:229 (+) Transcript_46369:40-726(+)|eukprot:CAMPEP_0174710650 /NCGR_PEP_ID=MMETSP1094-20130205/12215_1 /TAXON_ID=156173 /ORGANISM="Chrysochromulina brevifilum, Strain UTEX LB 985" /LENGTH=228 /DNA_ID=CAMNT_0015909477 /DNA_START=11 /DNA_END=697 /DNA_ORIENTATION=-